MSRSNLIKPVVMGLMLVFMLVYFFLNSAKLTTLGEQWAQMRQGESAPVARITLGGRTVWQKRLLSTGFFDGSGTRQVHYLSIDGSLLQQLQAAQDGVKVSVGGVVAESAAIHRGVSGLVRVDMPSTRLYFAAEDNFRSLALAAWNENVASHKLVMCLPAALCQTLKLSSRDWGRVEGPYLKTDINPLRRGMPRGRWMVGPRTAINVHSAQDQHVVMLVSLLGLLPDQQIAFRGAVAKVQQVKVKHESITVSGAVYYPKSFIVYMDLKTGDNALVIAYSKWKKPAQTGSSPLAAYLMGMKIK